MSARLPRCSGEGRRLLLALLLLPPLLWLGVIYVGSLLRFCSRASFRLTTFRGLIKHELTLKTYAQLLSAPISTSSAAQLPWRRW